jgi:radical SAM protein with 4Fe4S-binding SPASM domain
LIIKPTEKCNFKCTFCSSTNIADDKDDIVSVADIRRFLVRYPETQTIIVNGGDPLMMPVQYYWDIIAVLDELEMEETVLSLTTNLWPFYKKPSMWSELFNHPRIGVHTSFQYGDKRLKGDYTPFTEEEFWGVSDAMLEHVGYRPGFIAVIDESNRDTAVKTVELAKAMGVVCKLNYANASGPVIQTRKGTMGNEGQHFVVADMYEVYLEIYAAGLAQWEHSTQQMMTVLAGGATTCPLARDCDSGIRNMQPNGGYYSCGSFGDDGEYPIDFEVEMAGAKQRPLQVVELASLKQSCYFCPMFSICNGCKKSIRDAKKTGRVEEHCVKMKALAPQIIDANGLTGQLIPTDYVNEAIDVPSNIIAVG